MSKNGTQHDFIDGRSAAASNSPRTTRNRSGAHNGDGGTHAQADEGLDAALNKAHFRVSYPPNIRGGGKVRRQAGGWRRCMVVVLGLPEERKPVDLSK